MQLTTLGGQSPGPFGAEEAQRGAGVSEGRGRLQGLPGLLGTDHVRADVRGNHGCIRAPESRHDRWAVGRCCAAPGSCLQYGAVQVAYICNGPAHFNMGCWEVDVQQAYEKLMFVLPTRFASCH
jgi:hypothetical protein